MSANDLSNFLDEDNQFAFDRALFGTRYGYKWFMGLDYDHPIRRDGNKGAGRISTSVSKALVRWIQSHEQSFVDSFMKDLLKAYNVDIEPFAALLWEVLDCPNWIRSADCDSPYDSFWQNCVVGIVWEIYGTLDVDENGTMNTYFKGSD